MDRGLLTRSLIVGFVVFMIAAGGLFYMLLDREQPDHYYSEMAGTISRGSDGIRAIDAPMLIGIGFVIIIAAGIMAALASPSIRDRPRDVFTASAVAGSLPVALLWLIFWCLGIAGIIRGVLGQEAFGSADLIYLIGALVATVLTVGAGGLIAGLSGRATRAIAVRIG